MLVSVITINFNNKIGLNKTIESVLNQSFKNFEFIIIDGASTDGSVDIINQYKSHINHCVSELDKGIYDAQNKGILLAKGQFCLFLNSGDTFSGENVLEQFANEPFLENFNLFYGQSNLINENGKIEILSPPANISQQFWYRNTLNHQAVFFKKSLFDTLGLFDLNLKLAADFEFLLRAYSFEKQSFKALNFIVCNYDNTGISAQKKNYETVIKERNIALKKHFEKAELSKMKSAFLQSLTTKNRFLFIISENESLKTLFKPIFYLYNKLK